MPTTTAVSVTGLRQFQRELKAAGDAFPAEMKAANKEAADTIRDHAQRLAGRVSRRAAKGAESLRSLNTSGSATVALGNTRTAAGRMALGAEYGSLRYGQFAPWRGSGDNAGYFLWPTIRDDQEAVLDVYLRRVDAISRRAFPN